MSPRVWIKPGLCETSVLRAWSMCAVCSPSVEIRFCVKYRTDLQSLQAAEAIDDCRHVYRHALPVRWMKVPLSLAEPGETVAGLSGFWFTVRSISWISVDQWRSERSRPEYSQASMGVAFCECDPVTTLIGHHTNSSGKDPLQTSPNYLEVSTVQSWIQSSRGLSNIQAWDWPIRGLGWPWVSYASEITAQGHAAQLCFMIVLWSS